MISGTRIFDDEINTIEPGDIIYLSSDANSTSEYILHEILDQHPNATYNDLTADEMLSEMVLERSRFTPQLDDANIVNEIEFHEESIPKDSCYLINNFHKAESRFNPDDSIANALNILKQELKTQGSFGVIHSQNTNSIEDRNQSVDTTRSVIQTTVMNISDAICHFNVNRNATSIEYTFTITKDRSGEPMTEVKAVDITKSEVKPNTSRGISS